MHYTVLISYANLLASILLPIIYIISFARNSRAYKLFCIYLIGMAVIESAQWGIVIYNRVTGATIVSLFLFIYYFIFQFITMSLFYKSLLSYKWVHYITFSALVFFVIQYIVDPSLYFKYNAAGAIVSQGIIAIYSLLYFYKSLNKGSYMLILNTGIFLYFMSSMLVFASGNLVLDQTISSNISNTLMKVNQVLYLVFQLFIFIEWWKNFRRTANAT